LTIFFDFPEVSLMRGFISYLKQFNFKCKQSILTTNFSWVTIPKSAQISTFFGKFCANFNIQKQAFLKLIFKALPVVFLIKKY